MAQGVLTLEHVEAATRRLGDRIHRTPVVTSKSFNEASGYTVFFKCENQQRAGSFKSRGALNKLSLLSAQERARGVVAFSSGNHAQGVALAARLVGTTAVICMPTDAPKLKLEATRQALIAKVTKTAIKKKYPLPDLSPLTVAQLNSLMATIRATR